VIGGWRKLNSEMFNPLPNNGRVISARSVILVELVCDRLDVCKCTERLFGRPDSKRLPVIYGCRKEYNIVMDLIDLG